MATFYPYFSPCPIGDCAQYLDQLMNWDVKKCGGTAFLSDRGTFACGHMVRDSQCRYCCGQGTTEFPFVEASFACKNHRSLYKQCHDYGDFMAAMNTLVEFIDLAKPAGVESQTFRRWLQRTTRAVVNQYSGSCSTPTRTLLEHHAP